MKSNSTIPIIILSFIFTVLYACILLTLSGGNIKNLIFVGRTIGAEKYWRNMPLYNTGYDGQYYFYISHNPFDIGYLQKILDVPAHRYKRIVYPTMVWVISGGNHNFIPWVMFFLNILLIPLSVYVTTLLLRQLHVTENIYYITSIFIPSFLYSLKYNLSEPLATVLLLMGFLLFLKKRFGHSGILFLLSSLTKEAFLLFPIIIIAFNAFSNSISKKRLVTLSIPILFYLVWHSFVFWMFGEGVPLSLDLFLTHYNSPVTNIFSVTSDMFNVQSVYQLLAPPRIIFMLFTLFALSAIIINIWEFIKNKQRNIFTVSTIIFGFLILCYGKNIWLESGPESWIRVSEVFFIVTLINLALLKRHKFMLIFYPLLYISNLYFIVFSNDIGILNAR